MKKIDKTYNKYLTLIGKCADELGYEAYVIGGYVRDMALGKEGHDIDVVCVGSGISLATKVSEELGGGAKLDVFQSYGTAHIQYKNVELEFVGARKEFYHRESRNPIVENGTLKDDMERRDFTINDMAICLNDARFGEFVDTFGGMTDLENGIIRTPLDPNITFSDDPLRMLRAIRFATRFGFKIDEPTYQAIKDNCDRLKIITTERIVDEVTKILKTDKPSVGFLKLEDTGLLKLILPELSSLNIIETVDGVGHKNVFLHTLKVLDNVAEKSDNVWLRWAALLHDVGKLKTKKWDSAEKAWTFYGHATVGEKMVQQIFTRLKMPLGSELAYVKKMVSLHMRPIDLVSDGVTDSGVRRILFNAGNDIDELMILCSSDITSRSQQKVERFRRNYKLLKQRMREIEEKDHLRNFQPPVSGDDIMEMFNLKPCKTVGILKEAVKNAILDGEIPNEKEAAIKFVTEKYKTL